MKKTALFIFVLFLATSLFIQAQTDVTDIYLKNPGFDIDCNFLQSDSATNLATIGDGSAIYDVTGWIKPVSTDWTACATFEYGYGGSINNSPIPFTAADGTTTGSGNGALGLTIGWGASIAYIQEVTLPTGIYILKYNAYNSYADATLGTSASGWIANVDDPKLSSIASFPSQEWISDEVQFMVNEETTGQIQIGFSSVSGTSSLHARVFFDDVQLFQMPLNDDATLVSLSTNIGELDPEFDPLSEIYEVYVPYATESINVLAEASSQFSEISYFYGISGLESSDGVIPFDNDGVDVEIIVTATTGTETSYYLGIYVEDGASDASLENIELSVSAIEPMFNKETMDYTAIVPYGTSTIDVTAIPTFNGATISGDGTLTLANGIITTTITVTSEDASASESYNLTIKEADGSNYALNLIGETGPASHVLLSGANLIALPLTLEMWIKPEGTQVANAGLFYNLTSNIGLEYISSWQGTNKLRFIANAGEGGMYGGPAVSGTVSPDVWHHVAVIMTDSTRTMYVDGIATTENAGPSAFSTMDFSTEGLYLGWDAGANTRAYKGLMDEVRVWNTALTLETLDANKYEVLNGDENDLLVYYNFDVNSSTSAYDLTSNAAHGTIVGASYETSFPRANLELSELSIDGIAFVNEFVKGITEYTVILPEGTSSINIIANAVSSKATIDGSGTVAVDGSGSITVTCSNDGYSQDYIINYITKAAFELKHSYSFIDGTAKDMVGDADGVLYGEGYIADGMYTSDSLGSYIEFPAEEIAINTYPALSIEAYIYNNQVNPNQNTMIAYFGGNENTYGVDALFFSTKDVSTGCKAAISCGNYNAPWDFESGVSGAIIGDDTEAHHVVYVLNYDSLSLYLDGEYQNSVQVSSENLISNLSNDFAYLFKSGYSSDNTWKGSILEYNIYIGEMDAATVASNYTLKMASGGIIEDGTTDATLSNLTVDGDTIEGFNSTYMNYTVIVPFGTTKVPTITATAKVSGATAVVTPASDLAGATSIVIISQDGNYSNTYTVNFEVAVDPTNATLSAIAVNGTPIANFDAATLSYVVNVAIGTGVPTITATTTNPMSSMTIVAATLLSDTTEITVLSKDSTVTTVYSITFQNAASLNENISSKINVYPTVSSGEFVVQTAGDESMITVYSLSGTIIKQVRSNTQKTTISLDKAQIYIMSVISKDESQVFRIIKQ